MRCRSLQALCVGLALLGFAAPSLAAPIRVTTSGSVFITFGSQLAPGDPWTATFVFDPSLATSSDAPGSTTVGYAMPITEFSLSFGGITRTTADIASSGALVQNDAGQVLAFGAQFAGSEFSLFASGISASPFLSGTALPLTAADYQTAFDSPNVGFRAGLLCLQALCASPDAQLYYGSIDKLTFTAVAVSEPGTLALLGFALVAVALLRARRRSPR